MSARVTIVDGPLPAPSVHAPTDGCTGAWLLFEGVVRATEAGHPIAALRYEIYEPMASRLLQELAEEFVHSFGLDAMYVEHSRGDIPVGARSFRLAIASPHRTEALAAMDGFITRMKRDVPIWKTPLAEPTA